MITFYSGTPGSGKSLHMAGDIFTKLGLRKEGVISTVDINTDPISKNGKKQIGRFTYIPITEINPKFLYQYAYENHIKGKEGQTLVIMDECQILFNPREFSRKDRLDWINFFTQHRHLGYNFILISQFDRLIDRQIRSLFEYEVKHRKINNYGIMFLLPFTLFFSITYWYGAKVIIEKNFFLYRKRHASIYDSYIMFDKFMAENSIELGNASVKSENAVAVKAGVGGSLPKLGQRSNDTLLSLIKGCSGDGELLLPALDI